MARIAKYFIYLIFFLFLLVGALVALVFSIDPSRLKPTLERELSKQGIKANFGGDIDWQFYPSIGLSVEALSLSSSSVPDTEHPLAYVDSMAFSVRLMPLLRREILVDGIRVTSARLNLVVDENGNANWEALGSGETAEEMPDVEPTQETVLPEIQIDELTLSGLSLNYTDRQAGENFEVENLSIGASNFSLDGTSFPLSLSISATLAERPPVSADLSSIMTLSLEDKVLSFKDASLQLNPLAGSGESVGIAFNSRINWHDPLNITASVNSSEFNPRKLIEDFDLATAIPTQNPRALNKATFAFDLSYSPEQIAVTNIKAILDNTHIQGNTTLTATDNPDVPWRIESRWNGDRINVDDYLPPTEETTPEPQPTAPQPLPSETIRSLNALLGLTFDEVIVAKASIKNLVAEVQVNDGLINLSKMDAQAFDGDISTQGTFDARTDTGSLALTLDIDSIDVGQLARHFAELHILTGQADTKVLVTGRGQTDQDLMNSLVAETEISSDNLKVSPINLEQQYCKLLAALDKRELTRTDWNAFTELRPVTLGARYAADQITLASLDAAIDKLSTRANGTLNLETGRFDFPIDISLADFSSGPEACGEISEKWRKRAIPLRCKGNLSDIGADTCLPDTNRIGDMVKAAAGEKIDAKKQELQQKTDEKVEEKKDELEDKAKDKLEKQLDRLKKKGLFN